MGPNAKLRKVMKKQRVNYRVLKEEGVISMSRGTFYEKMNGKYDWWWPEVVAICNFLDAPYDIFLG
ncbi:MAG: hypothetical protein WC389_17975 [Lutibacter sp.]|jgi:hypothetical protein